MRGLIRVIADEIREDVRRANRYLRRDAFEKRLHQYQGFTLFAIHAYPTGPTSWRQVATSYPEALEHLRDVEVPLLPAHQRHAALQVIENAKDTPPGPDTPRIVRLADRRAFQIMQITPEWFREEVARELGPMEIDICPQCSHCAQDRLSLTER